MVMRRSVRPNPLLKHVEEYRKSSKPSLKLEPNEVKRLAHMQAEAFVSHSQARKDLNGCNQESKRIHR